MHQVYVLDPNAKAVNPRAFLCLSRLDDWRRGPELAEPVQRSPRDSTRSSQPVTVRTSESAHQVRLHVDVERDSILRRWLLRPGVLSVPVTRLPGTPGISRPGRG